MATHQILAIAMAAVVIAPVALASSEAASNADLLCLVIDNTRSIAPCAIFEARHAVAINIKPGAEDAVEVCRQVQASLVKQRMFFDGDVWRLDITTPASGGKVVASCDLPQTPK